MQTSPALRDGSPLPHTLRPGALGRLRNGIRAFPCDKAQRPALCANVGPDIDKSDGAQPFRQRVRRIRPHPVHYGAPPGIPDSSFTIKNTPDGPSTRNTSAKAAGTSGQK